MYIHSSRTLRNLSRLWASKIVIPALLVAFIAVTLHSVHRIRAVSARKSPEAPVVNPSDQQRPALDALRVTLRPTGFEPAEVTRPAGRFLLALNDRSGQRDTSFTLTRITGERLKQVRLRDTPRKHEWREVVSLPPGRYILSDAANPERVCQILLTN